MKKLIIANWKMFKTKLEIDNFKKRFEELLPFLNKKSDYAIAVSSIYLDYAKTNLKNIEIIAQDCYFEKEGAFTGNISYNQLLDCNIKGSIVGHSERRSLFNDTDEIINKKTKSLLENNMLCVLCVGESDFEYQNNKSFEVVKNQIEKALNNIKKISLKNLIIAYEPIWAIGTGKIPTVEEVNNLIKKIRLLIAQLYDNLVADELKILYGGSVNNKNAKEFLSSKNINGALVGGFSLDPNNFIELIKIGAECE